MQVFLKINFEEHKKSIELLPDASFTDKKSVPVTFLVLANGRLNQRLGYSSCGQWVCCRGK